MYENQRICPFLWAKYEKNSLQTFDYQSYHYNM